MKTPLGSLITCLCFVPAHQADAGKLEIEAGTPSMSQTVTMERPLPLKPLAGPQVIHIEGKDQYLAAGVVF